MIDSLIGQRYRIKALIGEGGMASVYAALDEKLDRRVAIKILHTHLARNPDIRERFLLEAKTVSGLDHHNIIRVYDFSGLDSDQLWMVMEILYGEDLSEYVKSFQKNRLHFVVASLITREVCRALHEAHKLNIVHRDIKPENIMMLTNGQLKLMDFGIAKVHRANATQTGIFMGSPSYMSPEQIRGTDVDIRADIYSLSVLFYEIVTGTLPFLGKSTAEVINRIMVGRYTSPTAYISDLPPALHTIIVRGMQGHKEDRFASILDMAEALDRFFEENGLRDSRTELEEFTLKRSVFEDRISKLTFAKPAPPGLPLVPDAKELDNATIMMDGVDPNAPTQPPLQKETVAPEGPAVSQAMNSEQLVKAAVEAKEAEIATRQRELSQAIEQALPIKVVRPEPPQARAPQSMPTPTQMPRPRTQEPNPRTRKQTTSNFGTSPVRPGGTTPPRTPGSQSRQPTKAYYREFQEDERANKKSNLGLYTFILVAAAAAFLFFVGGERFGLKPRREVTRVVEPKVPKKPKESKEEPETAPETAQIETPAAPEAVQPETTPIEPVKTPDITPERPHTSMPVVNKPVTRPQPTPVTPTPKPIAKIEPAKLPESKPVPPKGETLVALPPEKAPEDKIPETKPEIKGPGVLKVAALPAAEVFIDGKLQGTTNDRALITSGIKLEPGTYQLRLKRKGYKVEEQSVAIKAGETRQLNVTLNKAAELIDLLVRTNKTPSTLVVEEQRAGGRKREIVMSRTSQQMNLKPGVYKITVTNGTDVITRTLDLSDENKAITFNADFK